MFNSSAINHEVPGLSFHDFWKKTLLLPSLFHYTGNKADISKADISKSRQRTPKLFWCMNSITERQVPFLSYSDFFFLNLFVEAQNEKNLLNISKNSCLNRINTKSTGEIISLPLIVKHTADNGVKSVGTIQFHNWMDCTGQYKNSTVTFFF